jgi:hypothetical protein
MIGIRASARISEPQLQQLDITVATKKARQRAGQRRGAELIDGRIVSGRPCARDERVTHWRREVERR